MREGILKFFQKNQAHFLAALAMLALCFVIYHNSLSNGFNIDDDQMLVRNPEMHSPKFLWQNFFVTSDPKDYRPVMHFISMVIYLCFGPNPFGHHLAQLILFYACALALYVLVNMLFQNRRVAFLTSLFFIAHPINGLLVNYTAVACATMILPFVLSLIFLLLASSEKSRFYYFISLIWFTVSLLSHESTMTYLLYLAAVLFFVKQYPWQKTLKACVPYFLLALAYGVFRMKVVSLKTHLFDKVLFFKISIFSYIASFAKISLWYVAKLFFLKDIVVMWRVPVQTENLLAWNLGFGLGLAIYLYWLFFILNRKSVRFLGLIWFSIGFIPLTLACFYRKNLGFAVEPHWMFFSTIGFCIFLADLLVTLTKTNQKLLKIFTAVLLISYGFVSYEHNKLWATQKTYCEYWVKVVPGNLLGWGMLADSYFLDGKFEKAEKIYNWLSAQGCERSENYNNLGLLEMSRGNMIKAEENFTRAIEIKPSATAYTNLGVLRSKIGDPQGAQEAYLKAIVLDLYAIEAKFNLALIYRNRGEFDKAKDLLGEILDIEVNDEPAMMLLTQIDWESGDKSGAFKEAQKLLSQGTNADGLAELGSLFAANHYSTMAFALYSKALNIDPKNKTAHLEFGKLLGNQKQYLRAIVMWQEGLRYHPEEKVFVEYMTQAKQFLEQNSSGQTKETVNNQK